jgi:hypothetical protein
MPMSHARVPGPVAAGPPVVVARAAIAAMFAFVVLSFAAGTAAADPWRGGAHNVPGWRYMAPAERIEHQRRMREFTSYPACRAYQEEVHAQMAERARRQGATLERHEGSGCDQLRARGRLP